MSFLSVVARENFVTVMSDGRARKSQNHSILREDYQKFVQVTPNFFIAYTGHAPAGETLIKALEMNNFSETVHTMKFEHIYFILYNLIENGINKSPYKGLFSFGGKNENGEIEVYYINSADMATARYTPKNKEINIILLGNEIATVHMLDMFFNITGCDTPEQVFNAQKMLNDLVAQADPSVNNTTFQLCIEKEDKLKTSFASP